MTAVPCVTWLGTEHLPDGGLLCHLKCNRLTWNVCFYFPTWTVEGHKNVVDQLDEFDQRDRNDANPETHRSPDVRHEHLRGHRRLVFENEARVGVGEDVDADEVLLDQPRRYEMFLDFSALLQLPTSAKMSQMTIGGHGQSVNNQCTDGVAAQGPECWRGPKKCAAT